MITLEIQLPEELLHFLEAQAAAKGHATVSEYVQALIREIRTAAEQAEFEKRFNAAVRALERGEPNPLSAEDWHRLREGPERGAQGERGASAP